MKKRCSGRFSETKQSKNRNTCCIKNEGVYKEIDDDDDDDDDDDNDNDNDNDE